MLSRRLFDSCDATFAYVEADIIGIEASMCGLLYRDSAWTIHDHVDGGANAFTVDTDGFSNFTGGGNPLSVELLRFEAKIRGRNAALEWETANEINTLGFNLLRSTGDADGELAQLNETLILTKQAPGSPAGSVYTWIEDSIQPGIDYYYVLEIINSGGVAQRYGPTHAALVSEPLYRVLLPLVRK